MNQEQKNHIKLLDGCVYDDNIKDFKKHLSAQHWDALFIEQKGAMSVWHSLCYEPVQANFLKAVFDFAQKHDLDIPINKQSSVADHKGRSNYMIATAFGMMDKMKLLASHQADVLMNTNQKKPQTALQIAEEFFGEDGEYPDQRVIDMVLLHQAQQEKSLMLRNINTTPKASKKQNKI